MRTFYSIGLTLIGVLWAIPSAAAPTEAPPPSRGVELSIGPHAPRSRSPVEDRPPLLPQPLRFVESYIPPRSVHTPGLLAMLEEWTARERAATLADADRALPAGFPDNSRDVLLGVGVAGAAMALHPTLVAPQQGTKVQLNPSLWPLGITLQGVFH